MVKEVLEILQPERGGIFVDCTVGEGGHSEAILRLLPHSGTLICIDRDEELLNIAKMRLRNLHPNIHFFHANFSRLKDVLSSIGVKEVDGFLFDLGVSLRQLQTPERGFSFQVDGPLDMRMDKNDSVRAEELVNRLSKNELASLFRDFGEERLANVIASAIVEKRNQKPFRTTRELAELIENIAKRRGKIHPATKVFMALRIAVNKELEEIYTALPLAISLLKAGGRICVLSYHSLEDRIIKQIFKSNRDKIVILTPKPLRPSREEISINSRARSAKLRAAERRCA